MNTRAIDFIMHLIVALLALLVIIPEPQSSLYVVAILQFFVGIFQVISSIIRMFRYASFDKNIQNLLKGYWFLCGLYFLVSSIIYLNDPSALVKGITFFSAWGIALYYCVITYLLAFPNYRKSHLEI
jgi:hypothetical protein